MHYEYIQFCQDGVVGGGASRDVNDKDFVPVVWQKGKKIYYIFLTTRSIFMQ